jgi:predicted RND superfamily exporter protein
VLITSSLTPFRQMGQVTVYAIGLSLLAAVLVLPSMLALWDGWHRRRGDHLIGSEAMEEATRH